MIPGTLFISFGEQQGTSLRASQRRGQQQQQQQRQATVISTPENCQARHAAVKRASRRGREGCTQKGRGSYHFAAHICRGGVIAGAARRASVHSLPSALPASIPRVQDDSIITFRVSPPPSSLTATSRTGLSQAEPWVQIKT